MSVWNFKQCSAVVAFVFHSFSSVPVIWRAAGIVLGTGTAVTGEEGRHCSWPTARQFGTEAESGVQAGDPG